MNSADFHAAINNTPTYRAIFRVIQVPDWAERLIDVGERLTYDRYLNTLRLATDGAAINIGSSYVEFLGYEEVKR
jgi:hypothetical protein